MGRGNNHIYALAAVAAIVAATFAVYFTALSNGFVYDDNQVLLANPWVTDIGRLKDILTSSVMSFREGSPTSNTYRPEVYILWMGLYHMAGFSPVFFHFVNIALHAVNAVLVFAIARVLFTKQDSVGVIMDGQKRALAGVAAPLLAAMVFALHTVNSEVVNWVSAQAELSFALFVLLALYIYMRPSRRKGLFTLVLSAAFFFFGLLSKETAMAFIPLAVAYDISAGGLAGLRRGVRAYALFIATAAVYMAMRMNAIGGLMHHKQAQMSAYETVANVFPLVFEYFSKLAYPAGLNALYEFHPVHSLMDGRALAGIGAVVVFILAALFFMRNRVVFNALALVAVPLLPVLYIPALSTAAFADRYMYLSSAGFAILLAAVVNRLFIRRAFWPGRRPGPVVYVTLGLSAALLLSYSAASFRRSAAWRSDYTLWADTVAKSPNNPNAHYNLAWASQAGGEAKNAEAHYRETIRLDPGAADAHFNIGIMYAGQSRYEEAAAEFAEALRINPGYEPARVELNKITRLDGAGGAGR